MERLARQATDLIPKYDVHVDHTQVAALSPGDIVTVPVTAGTHDVYAIIDSVDPATVDTSSNHLSIDCQPDRTYPCVLLSTRGGRDQRLHDGWIVLQRRENGRSSPPPPSVTTTPPRLLTRLALAGGVIACLVASSVLRAHTLIAAPLGLLGAVLAIAEIWNTTHRRL